MTGIEGDDVGLAIKLADAAGTVIRRHFRTSFEVANKADESPVTVADRMAEEVMRRLLAEERPQDGVFGEEFGHQAGSNGRLWVLDPIDGTRAFLVGKPIFGTLIALTVEGVPQLGVIDQPILRERWVGCRGETTSFCGRRATVRSCARLIEARFVTTTPEVFETTQEKAALDHMIAATASTSFGGDCYGYGLVASGYADLVVEAGLKPYDFLAIVPVIEGAGGTMTDWRGQPLSIESDGQVIAAGDGRVHREALELVGGRVT
ncbi:MAG: histidinol-phosphatase [Geminicoccaceae bacterium]